MMGGVRPSFLSMVMVAFALGPVAGCSKTPSMMMPPADMGPLPTDSTLALSLSVVAPQLDGLVVTGGLLELPRVSLYGDVPADMRTMAHVAVALPSDAHDLTFAMAPYGLYSRAQVSLDDIRVHGTWKGTPLEIGFEAEQSHVDLLGPTLDYEPGMSAAFLITMSGDAWLTADILDGAAVGTDGTIHIDPYDNPASAAAIVGAMQDAFTLTQAATDE